MNSEPVVILAGGKGLRLPEETIEKPKPLVEIGGKPILWHVMKLYSCAEYNNFIICGGYKVYMIKEFFKHFFDHTNDAVKYHTRYETSYAIDEEPYIEDWEVTVVNTGEATETGGRLLRIKDFVKTSGTFLATYGDGLTDININDIVKFHRKKGTLATLLAVSPPSKFGSLCIDNYNYVTKFQEKGCDSSYINGGFFVLETEIFKYIKDDKTSLEFDCLPELVKDKELSAYKYDGFWKCMDSLKDKIELEQMWNSGKAPWKIWV